MDSLQSLKQKPKHFSFSFPSLIKLIVFQTRLSKGEDMITQLYGGILALIYLALSIETIRARRKHKVSLGYGPNDEVASIVSAHNNFASYTVILLFLLFLLETAEIVNPIILHALAIAFTTGRLLHYLAFRKNMRFKPRIAGMALTLMPLGFLGLLNMISFFLD